MVFGIDEHPQSTSPFDQQNGDPNKITEIITNLYSSIIDEHSLRDHFRLGKFRKDSSSKASFGQVKPNFRGL